MKYYSIVALISAVVNFALGISICRNKLKAFDLEYLRYGQSEMLIYAIMNNKKGFLNLVKENFTDFCNVAGDSVFLDEYVYRNILNLNALNIKNLQQLNYINC